MKQIKAKTKSKLIILVNLFLICTLMTVTVYSWFAAQADNRVDIYEIQVESKNALELSFDQSTWSGSLNLKDYKVGNKSVLDTLKLVEITGDGNTFRVPELEQKAEYAVVKTNGHWDNATANQDYIDFTVYMRSKDPLNVYLGSESAVVPAHTILTGENCENPSSYTEGADAFSRDCVIGALRVSFDNSADARQIWITNPNYHLNNNQGSTEYSMTFDAAPGQYSNGTLDTEGKPFFWNDPYKHYYYDLNNTVTTKDSNVLTKLPETVTEVPTSTDTRLAVLDGTADANGYYTGSVTFRIWIEGCDTEARRALVDGSFALSLVFDAFDIDFPSD